MLSKKYIFDPKLSKDRIIFMKPDLDEEMNEGNENDEDENNRSEDSQSRNGSEGNNSNKSSVYENNSESESNKSDSEEEQEEIKKNSKNYLVIREEVSPEVVKTVFETLSPFIEEDEEQDFKNVKKDSKEGNLRRFRRFGSSVHSSLEINSNKKQVTNRRVSVMNNGIVVAKKGEELKLNLFNNEEERREKEKKTRRRPKKNY